MKKPVLLLASFFCLAVFSCSKEKSLETGNNPVQPIGGGGGGTGGTCNSTVQKLTKLQSLYNANEFIAIEYTTAGQVGKLNVNVPFSMYFTSVFAFENNRIKSAALLDNNGGNNFVDSVIYRYNAAGKVDSIYRKGGGFNWTLTYDAAGNLTRINRLQSGGGFLYYWTVNTDSKGNIIKAERYTETAPFTYTKDVIYTYSRDDKKNPFQDLVPYMLVHDEEYVVFRYWGANNYVNQTYEDISMGLTVVTGWKNRYNNNCYPIKGQNTLSGQTLFTDDDWDFIYQ